MLLAHDFNDFERGEKTCEKLGEIALLHLNNIFMTSSWNPALAFWHMVEPKVAQPQNKVF